MAMLNQRRHAQKRVSNAGVHGIRLREDKRWDVFWFPRSLYPHPDTLKESELTGIRPKEIEAARKLFEEKPEEVHWFSGDSSEGQTAMLSRELDMDGMEPAGVELTGPSAAPAAVVSEVFISSVRPGSGQDLAQVGWHQRAGDDCALNAVANAAILVGSPLPDELYHELLKTHGELSQLSVVSGAVSGSKGRTITLSIVPVEREKLAQYLLEQRCGVFAVETGGHCLAVDCGRRVIVDSDPFHPRPLDLDRWHRRLNIRAEHMNTAYRVLGRTKKARAKKHAM